MIPSIREIKDLTYALNTDLSYVLLSNTHIGNLKALVDRVHRAGKKAIVTVELIRGFNLDKNGAQFLKQIFHVDAVIVSNPLLVHYLRKLGLYTILRIVLMDSLALENSIRIVSETPCNAVELRPAIYGLKFANMLCNERRDLAFFLAGFIRSQKTIKQAQQMGFKGVTLSDRSLWMNPSR